MAWRDALSNAWGWVYAGRDCRLATRATRYRSAYTNAQLGTCGAARFGRVGQLPYKNQNKLAISLILLSHRGFIPAVGKPDAALFAYAAATSQPCSRGLAARRSFCAGTAVTYGAAGRVRVGSGVGSTLASSAVLVLAARCGYHVVWMLALCLYGLAAAVTLRVGKRRAAHAGQLSGREM